ncbi:MAG: hypothetical protein RML45_01830 [Acetobacteraceae bacterium]|nr:hypothetical protein [Acetobacteraceae bacterium]
MNTAQDEVARKNRMSPRQAPGAVEKPEPREQNDPDGDQGERAPPTLRDRFAEPEEGEERGDEGKCPRQQDRSMRGRREFERRIGEEGEAVARGRGQCRDALDRHPLKRTCDRRRKQGDEGDTEAQRRHVP